MLIPLPLTHSLRRKASAASYRRAEQDKLQAQAKCKAALQQVERAKRQGTMLAICMLFV